MHHADPVDADDFDCSANQGSDGDVSVFLHTFRNGLRGGPLRDCFDPALLRCARLEGTSIGVVFYDGVAVGVCTYDEHGNVAAIDVNDRFGEMVDRFSGLVAA